MIQDSRPDPFARSRQSCGARDGEGGMNIFQGAEPHRARGRIGAPTMVVRNTIALGLLAVSLAGCMGWAPGRQAYWDEKVKEMCEKDGGVTVNERVKISRKDSQLLWGQGLPVPTENTRKDSPYFWERIEIEIRDSYPKVVRAETLIKRRSDGKVLGKSVQYSRRGGDFPTGFSEATSFACPQHTDLSEQIFLVEKDSK